MGLLLITILPSILIVLYFIRSDKFKEPKKITILTFIFGILITISAGFLNQTFEFQQEMTRYAMASAGFIEEPLKYLVLYFFILKRKEFNEPMDGLVYGTCVSLGFATYENMLYVYNFEYDNPFYIAFIRSFTAIPMHAICGIIMGFYFGMYVFRKKQNYLFYSLLIPICIHSSYNFFVLDPPLMSFVILIIGFFFAKSLFNKLKKMQKFKNTEAEKKLI